MRLAFFNREYTAFMASLAGLLDYIPESKLYWKPFSSPEYASVLSCGELLVHSAGLIEYAGNGLLANYWDHAAEWTMREALPTPAAIRTYLAEVEDVVKRLFDTLKDSDLPKTVFFPDHSSTTIEELLQRTLLHAHHHRGQLYAYIHLFQSRKLPAASSWNNKNTH